MPPESTATKDRLVRTLRIDEERIAALLEKLDAGPEYAGADRRNPRFRYRIKGLVVHMQQPGFAAPVPYVVPSRNLSSTGMSFLHGGFVHKGTRCLVQLITSYGTWTNVMAAVVRCRYLEGNVHEVGVRFDQEVNPAVYCSAAVQSRVLVAEDEPMQAKLVIFHLQQLNTEVHHAENGQAVLEMVAKSPYDLILMDMEMPGMDGFQTTAELRTRGYTGTIIAVTSLTEPNDCKRCFDAGCDKHLPKPLARADLAALVQTLREQPLFSTFHDDPAMEELLRAFVGEIGERARKFEAAMAQSDVETLKRLVRSFKGEGSTYGFDIISEVATRIEAELQKSATLADVRQEAERLVRLCGQVRAPEKRAPVKPAPSEATSDLTSTPGDAQTPAPPGHKDAKH